MARYRIGTVGYLNSEPLTRCLDPERFEVVADHPRGIARRLVEGDVILALAPVAAVLSDGDFRMVPEWGIGADGPVASVLLVAETPPEQWSEVVLDGESRTSVTLAQILMRHGPLAERGTAHLPVRQLAPGEGVEAARGGVAAVVIGDAARCLPDRLTTRIDLAEMWKAWTGKPFVFAVWAGRPGVPAEVIEAVRAAGRQGVSEIEERYSGEDLIYLRDRIRYVLDDRAWIGLRRYAALAEREGLIGSADVQLFGPEMVPAAVDSEVDGLLVHAAEGEHLDVSALQLLAAKAPASELAAAANVRCRGVHARERAGYLAGVTRRVSTLSDTALQELVGQGVSAVVLDGFERLTIAAQVALLRRVRGAGLQSIAPSLGPLVAAAAQDEVSWDVRIGVLRAAGLESVRWDTDRDVDLASFTAAQDVQVHVVARLTLAGPLTGPRFAAAMDRIREVAHLGDVRLSVEVCAWLPEGGLTEPGEVTSAEWLTAISLMRLAIPPALHVSASPRSQGLDLSQVALCAGADDLGLVGDGLEAAPPGRAVFEASVEYAERALRVAGFEPTPRDASFVGLGAAVTRFRRVRRPEERAKP